MVPLAPGEIVDNGNRMSSRRQIKSGRPTAITISTKYADFHMFERVLPITRILTAPASDAQQEGVQSYNTVSKSTYGPSDRSGVVPTSTTPAKIIQVPSQRFDPTSSPR